MKKLYFLFIGILLFIYQGRSQTIAAWDFFGEGTSTSGVISSSADVWNSNLDGSNAVTRGSGAAASNGTNSFRTTGFLNNGISTSNNDYFEHTLSAASGFSLSLSTINAYFAGTTTFSNSPGVTMQFAYSLDGTNFTLIGNPFVKIGNGAMTNPVDLTGISDLQNVPDNVTVTIRFYASGQTTTGGWGYNSPSAGTFGIAFGGSLNCVSPTTYYADTDGDSYGDKNNSVQSCVALNGYVTNDLDCDDSKAQITTAVLYYSDGDGDGFGNGNGQLFCQNPGSGYTIQGGDCNDSDNQVYPGATEICDGLDNDCDGIIDDGLIFTTYYPDNDGDGYGIGNGQSLCQNPGNGYVTVNGDCNDSDAQIRPGGIEICDDKDNDCNGIIDDGLIFVTYYSDNDNDGFGGGNGMSSCQNPGAGYVKLGGDCNDSDNKINPLAIEVCDGIDNDCDGLVDDSLIFVTYFVDNDKDGFGGGTGQSLCKSPGQGYITIGGDCNDTDKLINPFAAEICDGLDNDCDGLIDDTLNYVLYYTDLDKDGYGVGNGQLYCQNPGVGFSINNNDCDDNNNLINPNAAEICDGIDNNCSGSIDEGLTSQIYYVDNDNDGYGDGNGQSFCQDPGNGYALLSGDCDDTDKWVNPDEVEVCDGIDNDCDGSVDEGFNAQIYFVDADNDGFGVGNGQSFCQNPGNGYSLVGGDCDDTKNQINPSATEVCDGIDNDCDGSTDEGLNIQIYYVDNDNDGFGTGNGQNYCQDPGTGFSLKDGDCDDANASVNPNGNDVSANGVDEDCDGVDGALELNELSNFKFTISPNPSSGIFFLSFNEKVNGEIKILELNGKLVKSLNFSGKNIQLNEDNLQKGCYFIQVNANGASKVERIIIE